MQRVAFTMKLKAGFEQEYKRRHDELWPEMIDMLKQSGISHYSIFLDRETNVLFGYLLKDPAIPNKESVDHPVVQRWWKHMADIMETNPDFSPVQHPLIEVFYLQ